MSTDLKALIMFWAFLLLVISVVGIFVLPLLALATFKGIYVLLFFLDLVLFFPTLLVWNMKLWED